MMKNTESIKSIINIIKRSLNMPVLTDDELKSRKINFVKINKDLGKFELNGKYYGGITGYLSGISSHIFEYQGRQQKKLDIYLKDESNEYQVQFGYTSYLTLSILNSLMNIPNIKNGGELTIFIYKSDSGQLCGSVEWNKKKIPWKYNYEELKLKNISKENQMLRKDKIIEKWFEILEAEVPYKTDYNDWMNEDEPIPAAKPSPIKSNDEYYDEYNGLELEDDIGF